MATHREWPELDEREAHEVLGGGGVRDFDPAGEGGHGLVVEGLAVVPACTRSGSTGSQWLASTATWVLQARLSGGAGTYRGCRR